MLAPISIARIIASRSEVIIPQTVTPVKDAGLNSTILFLCSGNYCRSAMAEGIARLRLRQAGYEGTFQVASAGTLDVYEGQPPAPCVLEVLRELGANGQQRPPHQISAHEVVQADLILGVSQEHVDWIAQNYPAAAQRTCLLTDLIGESRGITDPGLQELPPLRECRDTLDRVISAGLDELVRRAQRNVDAHSAL
jgi:protein-tyrosine-phosphatase